jgi:hypothetical protein
VSAVGVGGGRGGRGRARRKKEVGDGWKERKVAFHERPVTEVQREDRGRASRSEISSLRRMLHGFPAGDPDSGKKEGLAGDGAERGRGDSRAVPTRPLPLRARPH